MVKAVGLNGDVGDVGKSFASEEGVNEVKVMGDPWARTAEATARVALYRRTGVARIWTGKACTIQSLKIESTYSAEDTRQASTLNVQYLSTIQLQPQPRRPESSRYPLLLHTD